MSIINSNIGHEFIVDTISARKFNVDTFINIIKRREQILYKTTVDPDAANIAFVSSKEVSSSSNLSIADRSTSLAANRATEIGNTTISSSKTFTISTENFVVTDIFATSTNTVKPEPLFYKHIFSTSNVPRDNTSIPDGLDLASGVSIVSFELLDQFLQPINVPEKSFNSTQGILYNNLVTSYENSGNFTIYYIRYTVNNNGTIQVFTDLLDNTTTFKQATFDDLSPTLEIITDGRKVYLVEESTSGFDITLPSIGTYSFKPLSASRLQIINPTGSSASDSWFVRITNGKFFTNINGVLLKYAIAEFLTQVFTPEPPIKVSQNETSLVLDSNLIKLDQENIFQDSIVELFVSIQINDSDGNGIAAFSTDTSLLGTVATNGKTYVSWDTIDRIGIKSIDHSTGIVQIDGITLKSSYEIKSTYYFTETNFEFTFFNFNPISNIDAVNHRVSIFIDPDTASTSKTQTLFFLKINETGKIVESNWPDFNNTQEIYDPNQDNIGVPLYYERYPDFLPVTGHNVFIDDFTVEASGIQTSNFLVLGDVTVSEGTSAEQVIKIDSRRRGGGIIDTEYQEALKTNPELAWFWDEGYWDGIPYPANASYLVEVPVSILENTASGIFTQQEVRDIVERHTAFGVYPITKAYGIDITVTGINPGAEEITLEWFTNV